jgi:hypothetical protein
MSYSLKTPVATFKRCTDKKAVNRPLTEVLDEIRDGTHRQAVEAVRAAPPEQRGELKKALPAFAVSGSSRAGRSAADLLNHSGLLQVDIDKIGVFKAFGLKDKLAADPHVFAAFISPSGDGIKLLVRIPADASRHRASFHAAESYFKERYQLTIDASCKDVMRLCFFSHDEELVLNPGAVELEVAETFQQGAKSAATAETENKSKSSSGAKVADEKDSGDVFGGPSSSYSSERLRARSYGLRSTDYVLQQAAKIDDFPQLRIHYERTAKFFEKPSRGHRNQAIVAIAAKLFYVVRPEFVLLMLDEFKTQHWDVYESYDGDFDGEALAMVEGLLERYPTELNEQERAVYLDLSPERQSAFRIMRSLAFCESDPEFPPPTFFQSRNELAHRLGQYGSENAKWIFTDLEKRGVIEMLKLGTQHTSGSRGKATTWRWLL